MIDVVEIFVHWHAGRRVGELHSSLGVDPKTIRKYTAPAIAEGIVPGVGSLTEAEWAERVAVWFPGSAVRRWLAAANEVPTHPRLAATSRSTT